MLSYTTLRQLALCLSAAMYLTCPWSAGAQGSAFCYQGQLLENGVPATGLFAMEFTVTSAVVAGTALAVVTNAAVQVENGVFSVVLDFGADVFDGSPRWLQVGVRTAGATTPFSILSPRQPITAVPYTMLASRAVHAVTADSASNVVTGGAVAAQQISAGGFVGNAVGLTNLTALTNLTETYWTKPVVFVVAGDSISKGNHVTPSIMTWPYWLTNVYWKGAPFVTSVNLSLESMNYAQDWLEHYAERLHPFAPGQGNTGTNAYLMVWLGANDLWRGDTAEAAFLSLSELWKVARADGFRVVAFTVTDSVNYRPEHQPQRRNLNRYIRTAAGQWDFMVDTALFLGDSSAKYGNTVDGVHFTTNRHALIAGLVDWTLRNGSRQSAPFPLSDLDACRGINAPNLSEPNQFDRMITIKPDPNADAMRSIYGVGLSMVGPYTALTMEQAGSSFALTAWRGKFELWSAVGGASFSEPHLSFDPVSHDLSSAGAMKAANGFSVGGAAGVTTNIAFLAPGPVTNYLRFVGGILVGITDTR